MSSSAALGRPYDHAIACLAQAGGDVSRLPVPLQTLLLVESAQTMIESGGLEFFYEADFPNNPPYAMFVEAYRRIGADAAADCIEASSLLFPFEEPELFEELRLLWLEQARLQRGHAFARLSEQIVADASVWSRLADYVQRHRADFTAR